MGATDAGIRRHFLPWDQPWLGAVTQWLAAGWNGDGPLDLSRILAVVPTRQSARRLREALAGHAASAGSAVFPPRTETPDSLLRNGAGIRDVATRLEARLAWTEVLQRVDISRVHEVFPIALARQDFRWAWRLSETLFRLQTQLTEGGLSFADVAARAGADFSEKERWNQLARLEEQQRSALHARGRREPHAAWREFASNPTGPEEVDRVVVLATPDPLPLALDLLRAWSTRVPIDVVIHAPEAERDAFDKFGRPREQVWAKRVLQFGDFEAHVSLCADPAAEAAKAAAAISMASDPVGLVGMGSADPEVLPLVERELARAGIESFNPEGRSRRRDQLFGLLSGFAALAKAPTFSAIGTLSRCPDVLDCLRRKHGSSFSVAAYLAELDVLHSRHMPTDLAAAIKLLPDQLTHAARGLQLMAELRETLRRGSFVRQVQSALLIIFGDRRFDFDQTDEAVLADAASAWREVVRECCTAFEQFPDLAVEDAWEIALQQYGELRVSSDKPVPAVELQGWLELLWDDTPYLIVAGLNDGLVPDAIVSDAFLPEGLRRTLGLKTNAMRFARDAYMLQALAASRRSNGRLELLFAKASMSGDPLRPSRLLLACEDGHLPGRVEFLFRPVDAGRNQNTWTRAWQLQPRRAPSPGRVRVTALKGWLECPFRFYLRHVLSMEAVDPGKSEMDAFDFGTLCHAALEAMARETALRDSIDERELREFLWGQLEAAARRQFGETLTLPLLIQLESARQRLAGVARVQVAERANGWVIARVEEPFSIEVAGLEVRGRIDRIDRHETSGAWRVLDYKTSDKPVAPQDSHLRRAGTGDEQLPAWRKIDVDGREFVWTDLQLPFYVRALLRDMSSTSEISCGYFNLPKATSAAGVVLWPELSRELLHAAWTCGDEVAARIRSGEFWPPAEIDEERDGFAALFHRGAINSVRWENAE